jgi:hypothetical protein
MAASRSKHREAATRQSKIASDQSDPDVIEPCVALFCSKEDLMKEAIDARDEGNCHCPERELTEERFLEQFAVLEESLAVLQSHMHSMSENARLFSSLARHIRRSTCPATGQQDRIRAAHGLGKLDHI